MPPELPQTSPNGAITPAGMRGPAIEPGRAIAAAHGLADEASMQAADLGSRFADMRRQSSFNLAENEVTQRAEEAIVGPNGVLNDPKFRADANSAFTEVGSRMDKLGADILARYPEANRDGLLAHNLEIRKRQAQVSAWRQAHLNQEKDVRDADEADATASIQTALSPSDPKEADRAVLEHESLLGSHMSQGLYTAGEHSQLLRTFHVALATARLQKAAMTMPEKVLAMTPEDAAAQGVLPEKLRSAQAQALETIEMPQKRIEAMIGADRAKTETKLSALAAQGQPISGELETARAHGMVSNDFYEAYSGHPFRPASDPDTLRMLDEGVDSGRADRTTVLSAVASGAVNPRDAAALEAKVQKRDKDMRTSIGAQKYRSWAELEDAIRNSPSYIPSLDSGKLAAARAEFMAAAEEAKKPGDIISATEDLKKKYAAPMAMVPGSAAKSAIAAKLKGAK